MSPRRLSDRTADRIVHGRDVPEQATLTAFIEVMTALVPEAAPPPSHSLALLLEQGPPVTTNALVPSYGRRRTNHRLRHLSLAGLGALGLLVGAASVNTLPDPAQQLVSNVVNWMTPLHLPTPDTHKPAPARPRPSHAPVTTAPSRAPGPAPATSVAPSAEPTEGPTAEPTEEPTQGPTEEPTVEPTDEPTQDTPTETPGALDLEGVPDEPDAS